jgi:hypothetical protein
MRRYEDIEVQEYIKEHLFETVMGGGHMDGYSNYIGFNWAGWLVGLGYNRDSGPLDISNFEVALESLGGEIEGKVEVRDCNHWACGWFKQIMVHSGYQEGVIKLMEITFTLSEYPVLDDSHFYELEYETAMEYFEQAKDYFINDILKFANIDTSTGYLRDSNYKRLESLALEIYHHDSSYRGYDDAYVDARSIQRYLKDKYTDKFDTKLIETLQYRREEES